MRGCKGNGVRFVSVVPSARQRVNWHKLEHRMFCLYMKKHFPIVWVTEHWHRLLSEVVKTPPSKDLQKGHLDMILGILLMVSLFE